LRAALAVGAFLGVVLAVGAGLVAIGLPFFLPRWAYDAIYGWRYPRSFSCRDAIVYDEGPAAATDRYVVDLGPLPPAPASRRYELCRLPAEHYVVAVKVPLSAEYAGRDWRVADDVIAEQRARVIGTVLSVEVRSSSGKELDVYSGDLAEDWVWSGHYGEPPFLYGTFEASVPKRARPHELALTVDGSALPTGPDASVVLLGGGWK
jgi:hypothetical protein